MSTEKKVIAKLTVKTTHSTLILLVFAHTSGIISYHLMGELGRGNRSLDELVLTKQLPCVKYDYVTIKNLVNAVVNAINVGGIKVVSRNDYKDELI